MSEIATALKVSEVTVHRDWKVIRAWLSVQLLPATPRGRGSGDEHTG
jgi:transcriptional antiterminator